MLFHFTFNQRVICPLIFSSFIQRNYRWQVVYISFMQFMVFVCVIWSFDDMGLGEQVILSDKGNRETEQIINIGKVIIFWNRDGRMFYVKDYRLCFFISKTFGTSGVNAIGSFQLSQLNSSSVQSQLKAAGIDTNSKQYKAAVKQMMSAGNGAMYGNIQGIKNLMSHYDKDGDYINPVNGLAGLLVTDENENSRKRIISIPDSSKEEMYELTKKEFLRENGVHNGDTTKRSEVYNNLYRKMQKKDRLAAGYTLEKYERIYRQAFYDAAKKADPNWEIGKPIKDGALDSVTRELAESGKSPAQATLDTKI